VDAFEETVCKVVEVADELALIELPDGSRREVRIPSQIDVRAGQEMRLVEFDDGSPPIFDWPPPVSGVKKLYVRLLDEGVDVWRPVRGVHLSDDVYRIVSEPMEGEQWEFPSGSSVRCRPQFFPEGKEELVAFEAI
jgi:hypothetical protein